MVLEHGKASVASADSNKADRSGAARAEAEKTESSAKSPGIEKSEKVGNWQEIFHVHSILEDENGEGISVLSDGSLRKYVSLKGLNVMLHDSDDLNLLADRFTQFINGCETDIQILVRSRNLSVDEYLERFQSHVKTRDDYLLRYAAYTDLWFREVQKNNFVPQREFYIVVSYSPPDATNGDAWQGRRSGEQHQEALFGIDRVLSTVVRQLHESNLKPQVLNENSIRRLLYSELNPRLASEDPVPPIPDPRLSEVSTLARSALRVEKDHLWLDGKYTGSMYLSRMPHQVWLGWLCDLLTIGVEYNLSIFIHQCDQEDVRKSLKLKYHLGKMAGEQLATEDLETTEGTLQAAEAIQKFLRSSDKAVDISAYISCQTGSLRALERSCDSIRRVFRNRGAELSSAHNLQLQCWQSSSSMAVDCLAISHRVMAPIAGTMWPFMTASCGTPDGVPLAFALASREPVLLDPFYQGGGKDANNMFIVGTTGAGKSFAVSMMIMRLLPIGMQFVVLDKTVDKFGTYRFIAELLGPELTAYIDLGPNSGLRINPFDLSGDDRKAGIPSHEKVANLLSLIDLMLSPDGQESLSIDDKSILDALIRVTYDRIRLDYSRVPTMSDLAAVTAEAASREINNDQRRTLLQLAKGLTLFTQRGAYGGLVDGCTNIDTNKPFIVFDTREVNEPRLERIAVFMLTEFVRRKAEECKRKGIRMAAVIDEASTLMRFKAGARLLDDLSRRSRHYGLMLVAITQQLKDFFQQSQEADSVVKNSHMRLLLRQDPSDLKLLKQALLLRDAEVRAIEHFARDDEKRTESHALLVVGAVTGTVRLVPSPLDYWVCTSEPILDIPRRHRMIQSLKERNPGISHSQACRQAVYLLGLERRGF